MGSILSTLLVSAGALKACSQALDAVQNNVANASTPGYARQAATLIAMPFDPASGSTGGVKTGEIASSRDEFAEQAVWRQNVQLGAASQSVSTLQSVQTLFDISGNGGLSKAMNNLFQSFSAWGQSPNDSNARQLVMERASDVAKAFQQSASSLGKAAQDTNQQIRQSVDNINRLAGKLQQFNIQSMAGAWNDPGLDARIHSTLEDLSQYADFTAAKQADGSWTVLLNGQTPLVIADQQFPVTYHLAQPATPPPANANAPAQAQILAADGKDITSDIVTGQLGSLLNTYNSVFPSLIGSGSQQGSLNVMAEQFADRVNQLLISGNISDGPPPQTGVPLFTYDAVNPTNVAQTISVNPVATADQLAAIDPGPPEVANGIPLALSQLAAPQSAPDEIDGQSYMEFYGNMASAIGRQLQDATNDQQASQASVAQAKNLRQQQSGVDLDEEAVTLLQFQRAYDANSRLISILNELSQEAVNLLAPGR
jgi:flagellar hook-associated protein 1 FlgK